jgi:hypothetical protein
MPERVVNLIHQKIDQRKIPRLIKNSSEIVDLREEALQKAKNKLYEIGAVQAMYEMARELTKQKEPAIYIGVPQTLDDEQGFTDLLFSPEVVTMKDGTHLIGNFHTRTEQYRSRMVRIQLSEDNDFDVSFSVNNRTPGYEHSHSKWASVRSTDAYAKFIETHKRHPIMGELLGMAAEAADVVFDNRSRNKVEKKMVGVYERGIFVQRIQ